MGASHLYEVCPEDVDRSIDAVELKAGAVVPELDEAADGTQCSVSTGHQSRAQECCRQSANEYYSVHS